MWMPAGGGPVELQLQKNVQEVHVNSTADSLVAAAVGSPTAASTADGQAALSAASGGAISCKIDPAVSAVLATCCADLDVDCALPFEVTR